MSDLDLYSGFQYDLLSVRRGWCLVGQEKEISLTSVMAEDMKLQFLGCHSLMKMRPRLSLILFLLPSNDIDVEDFSLAICVQ